jgi:hypothetical protein
MWFLPKKQNNLVAISCTPTGIACAWLCPSSKKSLYELKGYKRVSFDRFELINGYIHNPSVLDNQIISFLTKHALKNAYLVIGLRGASIYENIVHVPTTVTDPAAFVLQKKQQQIWAYHYLYSQDNAQATFYICSIPQSLLFQYKLLAIRHQLHIVNITTLSAAYLHAYMYGYGVAFRHSQLAYDMERAHILDNLVSQDIIKRSLVVPARYSNDIDHEITTLTPLFGLAVSQKG